MITLTTWPLMPNMVIACSAGAWSKVDRQELDIRSLANTTIWYVRVAMSGYVQLRYNLRENISYWTTLIQPCSSTVFNYHIRPEGGSSKPNEPPLDPPLDKLISCCKVGVVVVCMAMFCSAACHVTWFDQSIIVYHMCIVNITYQLLVLYFYGA